MALVLAATLAIASPVSASWEDYRKDYLAERGATYIQIKHQDALSAGESELQQRRIYLEAQALEKWTAAQPVAEVTPVGVPIPPGDAQPTGSVQEIICDVFGPYCSQALAVASCESGFSIYAVNGQYVGIFQMGSNERATYGDGHDARSQAQAAYAYFTASGSDWSPWSCQP